MPSAMLLLGLALTARTVDVRTGRHGRRSGRGLQAAAPALLVNRGWPRIAKAAPLPGPAGLGCYSAVAIAIP